MRWLTSLVLLALAGCASAPKSGPPEYLLAECPVPEVKAATNGELARTLNNYKWALKSCNDDKAALRSYHDLPTEGSRP